MNKLEKRLEASVRGDLPDDVLNRLGEVVRAAVLNEIASLDLGEFSEQDLPSADGLEPMLGTGPRGQLWLFRAEG